jgi:hypothetical protein
MAKNDRKILTGKEEIKAYIGIKSSELFMKFIASGMPAKQIDKHWYAHGDNLDDYFRRLTKIKNITRPAKAKQ